MPVDYVYDASTNVVNARPHGRLSVPDVLQYFEDLINDETISCPATEVVRFADVEQFDIGMITDVPDMLPRMQDEKKLRATVFVADSDLQFDIGRMMVTLYELRDVRYPTRLVRGEEELQQALQQLTSE